MYPERSCRLAPNVAHFIHDVARSRDQVCAIIQIGLTYFTQTHHSCASMETRRTHMLFQLFDARGDDRSSDPELSCRLNETLGLRDADKGLDILKKVHQFFSEKFILEV